MRVASGATADLAALGCCGRSRQGGRSFRLSARLLQHLLRGPRRSGDPRRRSGRDAQRAVNLAEVLVREGEGQRRLKHLRLLREGVRLADVAPAPLAQRPVEPLDVGRLGLGEVRPPEDHLDPAGPEQLHDARVVAFACPGTTAPAAVAVCTRRGSQEPGRAPDPPGRQDAAPCSETPIRVRFRTRGTTTRGQVPRGARERERLSDYPRSAQRGITGLPASGA